MQNTLLTNDDAGGGNTPLRGELHAGGIAPSGGDSGGGKILIFGLDYPKSGNSGGWSRGAKHKPQPAVARGKVARGIRGDFEAIAGGKARRMFTAFDMGTTPPTLIRRDYSLDELRKLGAKIPKLYFDEIGNIRGQSDELVMQGPSSWGPETFVKTHL
jgi:hypothetical protein